MSTTASAIGLPAATVYDVRDLWAHTTTESARTISTFVQPHQVVMYRVSAAQHPQANPPQVTVVPSAGSNTLDARSSTTVQVSAENNGLVAVNHLQITLNVPAGWQATPVSVPEGGAIPPGGTVVATWQVIAPPATAPIAGVDLTASATYQWKDTTETSQSTLPLTMVSPVQAPYLTANATPGSAIFAQLGNQFSIVADGAGVNASTDQYGAIYLPGSVGQNAVVQTTVTGQPGAGRGSQAGLMIRNQIAPDSSGASAPPEGVVLYVTSSFRGPSVQMARNATGGGTVTQTSSSVSVGGYPVSLRLVRSGATYTSFYSTDGGITWKQVTTSTPVTLPPSTSNPTQDAGIYHTSGTAGSQTEADFTGLSMN